MNKTRFLVCLLVVFALLIGATAWALFSPVQEARPALADMPSTITYFLSPMACDVEDGVLTCAHFPANLGEDYQFLPGCQNTGNTWSCRLGGNPGSGNCRVSVALAERSHEVFANVNCGNHLYPWGVWYYIATRAPIAPEPTPLPPAAG